MTDIDISRERIERLQKMDCADYLHLALLDEVDLWRERCRNFEGKKELVARLNELLTINAELLAALEGSWQYLIAWRYEYVDKPQNEHNAAQQDRIDAQIRKVEAAIARAKP